MSNTWQRQQVFSIDQWKYQFYKILCHCQQCQLHLLQGPSLLIGSHRARSALLLVQRANTGCDGNNAMLISRHFYTRRYVLTCKAVCHQPRPWHCSLSLCHHHHWCPRVRSPRSWTFSRVVGLLVGHQCWHPDCPAMEVKILVTKDDGTCVQIQCQLMVDMIDSQEIKAGCLPSFQKYQHII